MDQRELSGSQRVNSTSFQKLSYPILFHITVGTIYQRTARICYWFGCNPHPPITYQWKSHQLNLGHGCNYYRDGVQSGTGTVRCWTWSLPMSQICDNVMSLSGVWPLRRYVWKLNYCSLNIVWVCLSKLHVWEAWWTEVILGGCSTVKNLPESLDRMGLREFPWDSSCYQGAIPTLLSPALFLTISLTHISLHSNAIYLHDTSRKGSL